jgi:hypothetical protein
MSGFVHSITFPRSTSNAALGQYKIAAYKDKHMCEKRADDSLSVMHISSALVLSCSQTLPGVILIISMFLFKSIQVVAG